MCDWYVRLKIPKLFFGERWRRGTKYTPVIYNIPKMYKERDLQRTECYTFVTNTIRG